MTATRKSKSKAPKTKHIPKAHPVTDALSKCLADAEENVMLADGFEDALIGLSAAGPGRPVLAVYDYDKCIDVLMKRDGMSYDDALEFFEFNTIGAWVGDGTPVFMRTVKSILEAEGYDMKKLQKETKASRA